MNGLLARMRGLSAAQWTALAEATAALAVAAPMIAFLPFRRVVALVRHPVGRSPVPPPNRAEQIGLVRWAVTAAARRLPWRAKCFEQGLAAQWLLRRRGIGSEIHYGIARDGSAGLQAHVWVTVGTLPVVGAEIAPDFVEIDCFGALP